MYPSDPVELRGLRPEPNGTPRALMPIAQETLAWVVKQRRHLEERYGWMRKEWPDCWERTFTEREAMIRKIELCALVTIDVAMMQDLYAIGPKEAPCGCTQCPSPSSSPSGPESSSGGCGNSAVPCR